MMGESVIVSSVTCLLLFWHKSTFFSSKWSWKESKMVHGGLTIVFQMWRSWKKWNSPWRLLSTVYVSDGLESSQFCSYTQWSWNDPWRLLSTVYVSDGLESSQFCLYTQWSWNKSNLMLNSPCQSQMVLKEVTYGWWLSLEPWPWPLTVFCRVIMVTFQLTGLKVHVRVLGQHHGVRWKLVQTGVSSYLQVRSPLSWAPQMTLWMEMMLGVSMMVI